MPIKLKRRDEYRFAADLELGPTAKARLRAAERQLEEHWEHVQPTVEVSFGRRLTASEASVTLALRPE